MPAWRVALSPQEPPLAQNRRRDQTRRRQPGLPGDPPGVRWLASLMLKAFCQLVTERPARRPEARRETDDRGRGYGNDPGAGGRETPSNRRAAVWFFLAGGSSVKTNPERTRTPRLKKLSNEKDNLCLNPLKHNPSGGR